jgi:hypothetical protein
LIGLRSDKESAKLQRLAEKREDAANRRVGLTEFMNDYRAGKRLEDSSSSGTVILPEIQLTRDDDAGA